MVINIKDSFMKISLMGGVNTSMPKIKSDSLGSGIMAYRRAKAQSYSRIKPKFNATGKKGNMRKLERLNIPTETSTVDRLTN